MRCSTAGATASSYAEQLLQPARGLRGPSPAGIGMTPVAESQLRRRIRFILDPRRQRRSPRLLVSAAVIAPLVLVACSVSSIDAGDGDGESSSGQSQFDGVQVEDRSGATTVTIIERRGALTAAMSGDIEFASDREVRSIAADGRVEIEDTRGRPARSIEVDDDGSGLTYRYAVDGAEHAFDEAGREWFEATLLELFRRAGIDAGARTGRLYAEGGADAVFAEIERIESGYVRAIYLGALSGQDDASVANQVAVLERMQQLLDRDFERVSVIGQIEFGGVADEGRAARRPRQCAVLLAIVL